MMGPFDDLIPGGSAPAGKPAGGKAPTANQALAAQQRMANLKALAAKYSDVQGRYEKDLKGFGPGSLLEYLPLAQNKAFDTAASGLGDLAFAAFKVPGSGPQSDADQRNFIRANEPRASDGDSVIEGKLANIRNRIEANGVKIPGARRGQFKVIR